MSSILNLRREFYTQLIEYPSGKSLALSNFFPLSLELLRHLRDYLYNIVAPGHGKFCVLLSTRLVTAGSGLCVLGFSNAITAYFIYTKWSCLFLFELKAFKPDFETWMHWFRQ